MLKFLSMGAAALALAGCQSVQTEPPASNPPAPEDIVTDVADTPPAEVPAPSEAETSVAIPAVDDNCEARASANWSPNSSATHRVDVFTMGDNCRTAAAFMTIRTDEDQIIWMESLPTMYVFFLQYATSKDEMQSALEEWIDPEFNMGPARDILPEWAEGALEPTPAAEFPFYPEEGVTRSDYEALRNSGLTLFCYTQGLESLNCLEGGYNSAYPIGVQLFPG